MSQDSAKPQDLDSQIQKIKDKVDLRAWVDNLPDDARGIIVLEVRDPDDAVMTTYRYHEVGDITCAEGLYAVKSYEHFLLRIRE